MYWNSGNYIGDVSSTWYQNQLFPGYATKPSWAHVPRGLEEHFEMVPGKLCDNYTEAINERGAEISGVQGLGFRLLRKLEARCSR